MPIRPIFPIVTGFVNVLLAYRKNARPFAFDPYANASQRLICLPNMPFKPRTLGRPLGLVGPVHIPFAQSPDRSRNPRDSGHPGSRVVVHPIPTRKTPHHSCASAIDQKGIRIVDRTVTVHIRRLESQGAERHQRGEGPANTQGIGCIDPAPGNRISPARLHGQGPHVIPTKRAQRIRQTKGPPLQSRITQLHHRPPQGRSRCVIVNQASR